MGFLMISIYGTLNRDTAGFLRKYARNMLMSPSFPGGSHRGNVQAARDYFCLVCCFPSKRLLLCTGL